MNKMRAKYERHHETSESDSRQKWPTGRRHTPRKTNVKVTHAITTESDVRYETVRSATRYENEVENDIPHEIQSESDSCYKRYLEGDIAAGRTASRT